MSYIGEPKNELNERFLFNAFLLEVLKDVGISLFGHPVFGASSNPAPGAAALLAMF